jgi:hypothetical protein
MLNYEGFKTLICNLNDKDEVGRRRAILTITQEYLDNTLSANWLATELKEDLKWLIEEGLEFRKKEINKGVTYSTDNVTKSLKSLRDTIENVDNLTLGNSQELHEANSLTNILFVPKGKNRNKGIKPGLLFPVLWKKGDQEIASDKRLPTGLRILAADTRRTLTDLETDPRYRDEYGKYVLAFPVTAQPRWKESEENQDDAAARILDALFPSDNCLSAAATLLGSLYISVRGGTFDRYTLITGVGRKVGEIIGRIATVAESLEAKVELVFQFLRQHQNDLNRLNRPIRFGIPASDYEDAKIKVAQRFAETIKAGQFLANSTIDQKIYLFPIPISSDDGLLGALRPIREQMQAEPRADDPLSSQEAYFTALGTQDRRSDFHHRIIQAGQSDEHLVPKLKKQLSNLSLADQFYKKCYCVSLASRSWEFPVLDRRVFEPLEQLVVLTNDLETGIQGGAELEKKLGKALQSVMAFEQGQAPEPKILEIDIRVVTANLVNPQEIEAASRSAIHDRLNQELKEDDKQNNTFVINASSGSAILRQILLDWAPLDSLVVAYAGQTDPTTNLPLAGSHDLVLYCKVEGGRLEPLKAPENPPGSVSELATLPLNRLAP